MTVGLGMERGRRLPLSWGERGVVEAWLVAWLALVLLGLRLSLPHMELISCLMATYMCESYIITTEKCIQCVEPVQASYENLYMR